MKARISNRLDATETNLTATERFVFLLLLDVVGRLRGDRVSITFLGDLFLCALFCRPLAFRRKPTFSPTVERRVERYILRKENSLCVLCAHVPFLSWKREKKKIIKRWHCTLEFVFLSENPKENETFWCCALFDWVWRNCCCINRKHTYTLSIFCDWTRRRHWRNYWKNDVTSATDSTEICGQQVLLLFIRHQQDSQDDVAGCYLDSGELHLCYAILFFLLFWAGEISIETVAVLMAFFKPNIPCPFLFITTFFSFTIWNCVLWVSHSVHFQS